LLTRRKIEGLSRTRREKKLPKKLEGKRPSVVLQGELTGQTAQRRVKGSKGTSKKNKLVRPMRVWRATMC